MPERGGVPLLSRKLPTETKLALRGRCLLDAILFTIVCLLSIELDWGGRSACAADSVYDEK